MTTGAVSECVSKVEAELSAFWAASVDEQGHPKARAATMNFVAVSVPAEVDHLRAAVEDLATTRAGRAFLVTLDGRLAPWAVESDVSAVCHKEGDTVVCYDRIELHFGAMAAVRASSVISTLSLSEVPTIVEIGRSAPAPLVDALVKNADRLIVDSAHTGAVRIAEIAAKTHAPLGDRAFVRTFSWREFTARFFDEAPGAERAIGRIEVERTPADRGDPAALLLGWLGSRLGWRFESATRAIDAQGMPVEIVVRAPVDKDLPAGEIAAIRMTTAIDNRPLFCEVERRGSERVVRWTMSGPRSARHQHPLGFRDEGWVLLKAIDATEGDGVYRAAILSAAEWAREAAR
ncbi:MAG: glucose-6-phosphate dehydrogenase assembly protein OpcA [Minicystis sp.]